MAARIRVELDHGGVREILRSQGMANMVNTAAARIESAAEAMTWPPVVVNAYTTDRRAAAVTIAADEGLAIQAKDGVLTRAAGSIGAEVSS